MGQSKECDPRRIAQDVHSTIDQKYPGKTTLSEAVRIAESLATGTVKDFVAPLTANLLHKRAQGETIPSLLPAEKL